MVTLLFVLALIFMAMMSLKFTAFVVGIALIVGSIVKFITSFVGQEATLLSSIKAVLLSIFLMALAAKFSINLLTGLGINSILGFGAISIVNFFLTMFACSFAFSFCLDITMKAAAIVGVIFWAVAYPIFVYFGVAIFIIAA